MIAKYLREQTKDLHDAVEEKFHSKKIEEHTFSVSDYQKLLQANFQLIHQLENQVFSFFSEDVKQELKTEKRTKINALQTDIKHIGAEIKPLEQAIKIENFYEALGALYLMEGLTLGGNVIAKNLKKNPNFSNFNFHFFGIYGDEISEMWKSFLEVLDREVPNENQYPSVLEGVKKSYHYLLEM